MSEYVEETINDSAVLNGEGLPQLTLTTGVQVTIHKCKVRHIGQVLTFIKFIMHEIGMDTPSSAVTADLSDTSVLMNLAINGMDNIYPVASALCSLSEEVFLDLDIEDAMAILLAEWELNRAFFLLKILPMLGANIKTPTSLTSKVSKKKRSTRKKRAS